MNHLKRIAMKNTKNINYPRNIYLNYPTYNMELSDKNQKAIKVFLLQLKRKWVQWMESFPSGI